MAQFVLTNAYFSFASNDLSSSVKQITVDYSAETQDDTTMGDTSRSAIGGLKNWSMNVEFAQDFAASAIDSILFPLVGTTGAIEVRSAATSVGSGNPKWTGTALLQTYNFLGGSVGDFAVASCTFLCANGTALTRATS